MLRFLRISRVRYTLLKKVVFFTQPGSLSVIGPFRFSQLEMCEFLERGALGSLKRSKKALQERFFDAFFGWSNLDRFFVTF